MTKRKKEKRKRQVIALWHTMICGWFSSSCSQQIFGLEGLIHYNNLVETIFTKRLGLVLKLEAKV